jgi:hypothetical protein
MYVPDSYFLAHAHVLEAMEIITPSVLLRQDLKFKRYEGHCKA